MGKPAMTDRHDALNDIARRETQDYLRRNARSHLELAVGNVLRHHTVEQTKALLRAYADHLEEFG